MLTSLFSLFYVTVSLTGSYTEDEPKISPSFKRTGSAERALVPVLLRITH